MIDKRACGNGIELSIIIPVYNVEKYLEKCLQSVIEQIKCGVEVIIINDGSTDNSEKICEEYCRRYGFITLINQANQGLSMARNVGINNSKGRYLLFLDSDDWLAENILDELLFEVKNSESNFILAKRDTYSEWTKEFTQFDIDYGKIKKDILPVDVFRFLNCKKIHFTVTLIVIDRQFLVENNLYFMKGICHEDELWIPQVFCVAEKMSLFNKSIYCYRCDRMGSIMNSPHIKKAFDIISIIDELEGLLEMFKCEKHKAKAIKGKMAMLEWGLMNRYKKHKKDALFEQLEWNIQLRIRHLKYGKYRVVYIICCVFGIDIGLKLKDFCDAIRQKLCMLF